MKLFFEKIAPLIPPSCFRSEVTKMIQDNLLKTTILQECIGDWQRHWQQMTWNVESQTFFEWVPNNTVWTENGLNFKDKDFMQRF